jgi:hypothetical protein
MDNQTPFQLTTPVAFLIFNRPDTTARVFKEIARAKPPKLLVVADGPRLDRPGEAERCTAARAIIEQVDWECEVLTNYADNNMGCKRRVSSGLDWVFDTVEEAIILEDDCLPHPTFFRFCQELLERYRDDERVMHITAQNLQFGKKRTLYSYYFSRYPHCWGWASWRRAWQHYDRTMQRWNEIQQGKWLYDILGSRYAVTYWGKIFQTAYENKVDSWAYVWMFSCWIQSGLTILPNVNLVSNIGFGGEATHTKGDSPLANMPFVPMRFPLQHPPYVIRDARADDFTENKVFSGSTKLIRRIKNKGKSKLQRYANNILSNHSLFHKKSSKII